jgi:hypothetical protein
MDQSKASDLEDRVEKNSFGGKSFQQTGDDRDNLILNFIN